MCGFYRFLGSQGPAGALLWLALAVRLHASEQVVVEALSGRVFTGEIDVHTNALQLAIRSGTPEMYLIRPIDWSRIARVRLDGQVLTPRALWQKFETTGWPSSTVEDIPVPAPPLPDGLRRPGPSDAEPGDRRAETSEPTAWPPVRALKIEASVGKWTSGADNSGLLVRVYPLDQWGNLVPIDGTLEIDLIGQQWARHTIAQPFPPLGRWTQQVQVADFGNNGAVFQFPYQAWNPEIDLELGYQGAVHARFSVAGQGVFDDTATMVTLRPFSTTRDRLQDYSGERFFPQERTTRGVKAYGTLP